MTMAAVVIPYPKTPAGRALLKDVLRGLENPTYVATLFDWDGGAEEMAAMEKENRREVR